MLTNLRSLYKELLSRPQPKWLFCVVSHLLPKHTLTRSDKEFHLLLSCRTTKPKFMCAFYLTHNLPHSTQAALWGVISKQYAQPRASIKYAVFARARTYTHHYPHTLPDASSLMHLIAGDSSHCEKQCSPCLCCAVITLADLILSPSLFLQFSTSLLYISLCFFLYPSTSLCSSFLPALSVAI